LSVLHSIAMHDLCGSLLRLSCAVGSNIILVFAVLHRHCLCRHYKRQLAASHENVPFISYFVYSTVSRMCYDSQLFCYSLSHPPSLPAPLTTSVFARTLTAARFEQISEVAWIVTKLDVALYRQAKGADAPKLGILRRSCQK